MAEDSTPNDDKFTITIGQNVQGVAIGANASVMVFKKTDRLALREWWHEILRDYGRYRCYAIFLVLPSDREAIRYLTEYGKELNVISGENCLVMALSKNTFKLSNFDEGIWSILAEEHSSEAYSVKIAQLFEIDLTDFPCLLVFQDIRSPEHVTVALKGLTLEEIAGKMRAIFSAVQEGIGEKKDPLVSIKSNQAEESFRETKQKVINKIGGFAEKTFEAAMKAWMEAIIK